MTTTNRPKPGTKADLIERLGFATNIIEGIIGMGQQGMAPAEIADRAEAALELFVKRKKV